MKRYLIQFSIGLKLILCIFFFSCFSNTSLPDWVTTQPINSEYWYGYGIIQIPFSGDLREEARSRAIDEIASQISINITSKMKSLVIERDYDVRSFTRSITETRVNSNLNNIEIIETFNGRNEYIVLARLSRSIYYETIKKRKQNVVDTSLDLIKNLDQNFSGSTFIKLSLAMESINKFLDEPIIIEYPENSGKKKNLFSLIQNLITDYLDRIHIKLDPLTLNTILGLPINTSIKVNVSDSKTGNPLSNIPLNGGLGNEKGILTSNTDNDGNAEFMITRLSSKLPLQSFNVSINYKKLFEDKSDFYTNSFVKETVSIQARSPIISIVSSEKNLGSDITGMPVTIAVKNILQNFFGAEFTNDSNGDIFLDLSIDTQKKENKPNEYGLYITYGALSLSIKLENGDEIFSFNIMQEQGRSFTDHNESGMDAINNLKKKISTILKIELKKVF